MGLRSIELFAGAGGGCLASVLLGHEIACYVEREPYCQRILEQRIRDGVLPDAPIWDDVRTFPAHLFRGQVGLVCGGFPCQPFSTAAHGRHTADDLWPFMLDAVRSINPMLVFAENVQRAPIQKAAEDLAACGYRAAFGKLAASRLGAPHDRPRWWLLAHTNCEGEPRRAKHEKVASVRDLPAVACSLWGEDRAAHLGMDDGLPHRMDRLRALGNGQVPLVAASAFLQLRARLES